MKSKTSILFYVLALFITAGVAHARAVSPSEIIERARATMGTEAALDGLVTLRLVGTLEPADSRLPSATLLIIARKPCSQRMEIRIDEIIETTILKGKKACLIRSNIQSEASQMRFLEGAELDRIRYSTRQFFSYFRPDHRRGEKVTLAGMESRHGERCYKLEYTYPSGVQTIRYFSLREDRLVSTITENGVESVGRGTQLVGGIQFPERIDYYEEGRPLHTIVFHEVEVNQPLPSGIFDIPKAAKSAEP